MALNSSGPISLAGSTAGQSIAVELGQSASGQISLNDTNVRTLAGVSSGAITMPTDFWGKSSESGWLAKQYDVAYAGGIYDAGGATILSDGSFFFIGNSWAPSNPDFQYANGLARYTFTTAAPTQVYSKYYAIAYPGNYFFTAPAYSSYDDSAIGYWQPSYGSTFNYQKTSGLTNSSPTQPVLLFSSYFNNVGSGTFRPSPSHARDSSGNFYAATQLYAYQACCNLVYSMGVVKFDINGTALWGRGQNPNTCGVYHTTYWTSISLTPSGGNVYVSSGHHSPFGTTYSGKAITVAKLDSSGTQAWSYVYTYSSNIVGSIVSVPSCTDSSDNVYLVTSYSSSFILHKIDSSGNYQWGRLVTGTVTGSGSYGNYTPNLYQNPDLVMGSDGYVYVVIGAVRTFYNPIAVILKFDTSGNIQWVRSIAPYFGYITPGAAPNAVYTTNKAIAQNSSAVFVSLQAQLGCNVYTTITGKLLKSGAGAKANVFGGAPGQEVGYFNETGLSATSISLSRLSNTAFLSGAPYGGSTNTSYAGPYDTGRSPTVGLL